MISKILDFFPYCLGVPGFLQYRCRFLGVCLLSLFGCAFQTVLLERGYNWYIIWVANVTCKGRNTNNRGGSEALSKINITSKAKLWFSKSSRLLIENEE